MGLAAGMAVTLVIGLWISDEVTFNSSFKNHDRLAQVMIIQTMGNEIGVDDALSIPVGEELRTKYAGDIKHVAYVSWSRDHSLKVNEGLVKAPGIWVQPDFPEMFTLTMLQGSRNVLNDPSTLLISESLAKALFGNATALGKIVELDKKQEMKVGGVYRDFPQNTNFYSTNLLLPWSNEKNSLSRQTDWTNHCATLFVQLNDGIDLKKVNASIRNVPSPHITEWKEEIFLQSINDTHLYGKFENGKSVGGAIQFVWLFGTIGFFVLLLACINFMNLSTARSEKRAKEVGIRKTVGSLKRQLVAQFLGESLIFALLSLIFALILVQSSLPFFNRVADKTMALPLGQPVFWLVTIGFTLITGLIAGAYPAFYLSAFNPIKVLKGTFRVGRMASVPRKVLVVVQFTVSIVLIIATIVVFRQLQHARNRPVGYSRNGLVNISLTPEFDAHYDAARSDLLATGVVENVAKSSYAITHFGQNNSIDWKGKDPNLVIFFRDVNVSEDFGNTIGWKILQGRDFSKKFPADAGGAAILNEAAAKVVGFKNPIGETIKWQGKDHTIIGIVKDMVTQSPYEPVAPAVFFWEGWNSVLTIRVKPAIAAGEALAKIQLVFKKYNPDRPFEYRFADNEYATKFSSEERIGNLATIFAAFAIFISCLGLFGLVSFVAEQRSKEIGIRKVLGASAFKVWRLITKDFVVLVVIALVVAIPIAYYFMQDWLQDYQYRATISWWIFAAAGVGVTIITLITVSFQAIRAAIANPVNSLRAE
jgi:ABC-type antimicrobial peptide transport system permease subunit